MLGTEWGRKMIREDLRLSLCLRQVDGVLAAGGACTISCRRHVHRPAAATADTDNSDGLATIERVDRGRDSLPPLALGGGVELASRGGR